MRVPIEVCTGCLTWHQSGNHKEPDTFKRIRNAHICAELKEEAPCISNECLLVCAKIRLDAEELSK